MRVFINTWFQRFAKKEAIDGEMLKEAVRRIEQDDIDADLGGGICKQRLARKGSGKSGGYRIIICFRQGERAFIVYGFAKSNRDNITTGERNEFRKLAQLLFSLTDEALDMAVREGKLIEIP